MQSSQNIDLRNSKCKGCKYFDTCYGITDYRVRETCKEKVTDGGRAYVKEAPKWAEMSHHRFKE